MKKALVLLLVLSFVVGAVFAQELSFDGKIFSGVEMNFDNTDADATMRVFNRKDEEKALFFHLNGTFDADNFGAKFGIRATDANGSDGHAFYLTNAHAWVALLDKMIIVRGGLVDTNLWGPGGVKIDDENITGKSALQVEIKPMDGLSVGFSFWTFGNNINPSDPDSGHYGNLDDFNAVTIGNFFTNSAFGFKYSADAFWLSAALALKNQDYKDSDTDMDMTFGFDFSGIDNLCIHFSMYISELMKKQNNESTIQLGLDISYAISDAMNFVLDTWFALYDGFAAMRLRGTFNYKLNDTMWLGVRVPVNFEKIGDDLKFKDVGGHLWLRNQIGKAYIQPQYGLTFTSKDHNGGVDSKVSQYLGFYIGTTF